MATPDIMRIIDASLNRTGEGLRFLEDIARLRLNDAKLTEPLKTMRHELIRSDLVFNQKLLKSRDAAGDIGMDIEVPGEAKEKEIATAVIANSRRVQEALRTLEEMAKIPDTGLELDPEKFKHARFQLYTIERELVLRLLKQDKLRRLSGLYAIIDTEMLAGRDPVEVARRIISGGAGVIQLRDKTTGKRELLPRAQELRDLCAGHDVLFIMNDYLDIALACDADGVHLGQDDLPIAAARKLLPADKIIGGSTHSVAQAITAAKDGADYIAIGSIYPTASKETAIVVGLETLRQVRQAVKTALVAIGGINYDNAAEVSAAGADAVAVISAVLKSGDPEAAARQIAAKIGAKP